MAPAIVGSPMIWVAGLCSAWSVLVIVWNETAIARIELVKKPLPPSTFEYIPIENISDEPDGQFALVDGDSLLHHQKRVEIGGEVIGHRTGSEHPFIRKREHRDEPGDEFRGLS